MNSPEATKRSQDGYAPTSFGIKGLMAVMAFLAVQFVVLAALTRELSPGRQLLLLAVSLLWEGVAAAYVAVALLWRNRISRQLGARREAVFGSDSTPQARWNQFWRMVITLGIANVLSLPLAAIVDPTGGDLVAMLTFVLLAAAPTCLMLSLSAGFSLMKLIMQAPKLEFYDRALVTVGGCGKLGPLTGILWKRLIDYQLLRRDDKSAWLLLSIKGRKHPVQLTIPESHVESVEDLLRQRVRRPG